MTQAQLVFPALAETEDVWVWTEEEESMQNEFQHITVMCAELVAAVRPKANGLYVDATLGGGGHTERLLQTEPTARVIAFDRDENALHAARHRLQAFESRVVFVHSEFSEIERELQALGIERVDGIMADLGVSSPQLDIGERGMSFRFDGPLDMRMDTSKGETARDLIRRLTDEELANVIYQYGEEHRSRRIARSIKRAVFERNLDTTLDLRRAVVRAVGPARVGGVDPATKTFQAIRIAVNDELGELERFLAKLPALLRPEGAAGILSFHSLEDRLVKRAFADRDIYIAQTKKPMMASDEETKLNPRARSAKMRSVILRGDNEGEQ